MIFEDIDPNGFPEGHIPIFGVGADSSTSSPGAPAPSPAKEAILQALAANQPSERMQIGHFMARAGLAAVVAPIPTHIDEVIGTAMLIAGVTTIIDERFGS